MRKHFIRLGVIAAIALSLLSMSAIKTAPAHAKSARALTCSTFSNIAWGTHSDNSAGGVHVTVVLQEQLGCATWRNMTLYYPNDRTAFNASDPITWGSGSPGDTNQATEQWPFSSWFTYTAGYTYNLAGPWFSSSVTLSDLVSTVGTPINGGTGYTCATAGAYTFPNNLNGIDLGYKPDLSGVASDVVYGYDIHGGGLYYCR